jgi:hydrogenase maturation protease
MARMLVLGVGNSLLTDDGAGVHAAVQLNERVGHPPDLTILDAGTLGFSLLSALGDADALIAFDAARAGGQPGDISIHEGADFDRFVRRSGRSVHEVGLSDLLDMARLSGQLPERRVLIGIEPHTVDWGLTPTPQVAAALPQCVSVALDLIEHWRGEGQTVASVTVEEAHAH